MDQSVVLRVEVGSDLESLDQVLAEDRSRSRLTVLMASDLPSEVVIELDVDLVLSSDSTPPGRGDLIPVEREVGGEQGLRVRAEKR